MQSVCACVRACVRARTRACVCACASRFFLCKSSARRVAAGCRGLAVVTAVLSVAVVAAEATISLVAQPVGVFQGAARSPGQPDLDGGVLLPVPSISHRRRLLRTVQVLPPPPPPLPPHPSGICPQPFALRAPSVFCPLPIALRLPSVLATCSLHCAHFNSVVVVLPVGSCNWSSSLHKMDHHPGCPLSILQDPKADAPAQSGTPPLSPSSLLIHLQEFVDFLSGIGGTWCKHAPTHFCVLISAEARRIGTSLTLQCLFSMQPQLEAPHRAAARR